MFGNRIYYNNDQPRALPLPAGARPEWEWARQFDDLDFPYQQLINNNYAAQYRDRSQTNRRRTISEFRFIVNPLYRTFYRDRDTGEVIDNNPEGSAHERRLIRNWLSQAIEYAFETPGNAALILDVNNDFAGDAIDNQRVRHHEYFYTLENGPNYGMPHANVGYRVLHDSSVKLNLELLQAIIGGKMRELIQATPDEVFPPGRGKSHFLKRTNNGNSFKVLLGGDPTSRNPLSKTLGHAGAYDNKESDDFFLRCCWTSAPKGSRRGSEAARRTNGERPMPPPRDNRDPYDIYYVPQEGRRGAI